MIEAIVAAVSFFMWIFWFRSLDSIGWVQRFRIVERPPRPVGTFVQDFYAAMASIRALTSKQRRVLRVWASLPVYILTIALLHMFCSPKQVEAEPPSFLRLIAELALGIWAYDFVFYWIHLLMHRWPRLPHGHMVHHELSGEMPGARFLEADSVVNHSLADGALQVAVNILVQNLPLCGRPKHKLSRFLHNILVTYLLTEAHSGLDLPWSTHRIFPGVFGGALRHEAHHHMHTCCYHQFFIYLDDLLGYGPPEKSDIR
eukprot:gnl/TRDRNA2_/TRDRNA2_138017_c0_seq2.p1 gnl/TRDRNA2_/TRDRNA2_138017_c0~~gnl/TRDRNA2_/TRDRNA2_138017_c0_seq2.p1  ORF type:complete len:258 (-),score=18.95 gnl/TRDRNA2_/TRDRNA2_138017_c0_seq2:147-920(-)